MVFGKNDAWRNHPFIANCGKKPLPGFGIGLGLFGLYYIPSAIKSAFSSKSTPVTGTPEMTAEKLLEVKRCW